MDAILITITFIVGLVLGLAALVRFVRRDSFAGPGTGHQQRDELGLLVFGRRSA